MKKLEVRIEWTGDNFVASTELNGVVFTTSKKIEKIRSQFESLLKDHIKWSIEDGDDLKPYDQYELEYSYGATAVLKLLDKTLTRSAISRHTGLNQRQLGNYIQGIKKPRKSTESKIFKGLKKINKKIEEYT